MVPLRAPLSAQKADSTRIPVDAVVAIVGSTPITWFDVWAQVIPKLEARQTAGKPVPTTAEVRAFVDSAMSDLEDEEMLLAKAKDLKVEVPDAQVIPTVNALFRQDRERFATQPQFEAELAKAGYGTPDDFKRYLTETTRRQKMFEAITAKLNEDSKLIPVNVTDEELTTAFSGLKATLPLQSATVSWRQMIIAPSPTDAARVRARAKAESLVVELKKGGDFERVAKRESMDDSTKSLGGDRGWARRGDREPEFDMLAFGGVPGVIPLKPGEISRPVPTPLGFFIYRVDRVQLGQVYSHDIFIRPAIDSADLLRTGRLADSVAALVRAGTPFDSLTKKYHDYASKEDAGLIPAYAVDSLPSSYSQAFAKAKVGDVVDFQVPGQGGLLKYVVAQVTATAPAGEMTLGEVKERIRADLANQGAMRRYLDRLKKEMFIVVYKDRAYSFIPP